MTKKIVTLLAAMLILFPKISRADSDVLSIVQDKFKVFEEKAATVMEKYKGYQVNLQELSLNRDIVSSLRDNVEQEIRQQTQNIKNEAQEMADNAKGMAIDEAKEFANSRLSTVTLPGLDTSASFGPYATPELKQKTAVAYLRRSNIANDIEVNMAQEKRSNDEMIENLANIYANALVTRKKIMIEMGDYNNARNMSADEAAQARDSYQFSIDNDENEDTRNQAQHNLDVLNEATEENAMNDDDDTNNPDVNTVQFRYGQVARRASHRWLEIWNLEANYYLQLAKLHAATKRVGDIDQIIGAEEEDVDRTGMDDIGQAIASERKSVDLLEVGKQLNNTREAINNGDYAGALNSAAGAYATGAVNGNQNLTDAITQGAAGAGNVYNNASSGNWAGVVSSAGNATGNIIGGDAGNIVNTASTGAGNVYNSANSGDWAGVVSNAGNATGNIIGGDTGNIVNTASTGAGNVYNSANSGDLAGVVSNTGNTAGNIVGGTTGEIIGAGSDITGGITGITGDNGNDVFDNITGNSGIQGGLGRLSNLDTGGQPSSQGGTTPGTSTPGGQSTPQGGTPGTSTPEGQSTPQGGTTPGTSTPEGQPTPQGGVTPVTSNTTGGQ